MKGNQEMNDGIYESKSRGYMGEVPVKVIIEDGLISDIEILPNEETYQFSFYPFQRIPEIIKEYQTLNVDVISGATFSSRAVIVAVTDCLKQAGGDIGQLKSIPGPKRNSTKVKEKYCDVCVLGTGGSGSSAAAVASEYGAKVIVLEKAGYNGGITSASNCMLAVNSQVQLEAGVELPMDEVFEHMFQWSHFWGNGRLISKFLHETANTVQWLREKGIEIYYRGREQYTDPFECPVHFPIFGDMAARRKQLRSILETILENGGEIFYNTPARKLIKQGDKVVGVKAIQEDGTTLNVFAKAVIVASGCYDGNKELADKYFKDKARFCMPKWLAEGDGLLMCMEAGADTVGLGARVLHCTFPERAATTKGRYDKCITVCQMSSMPSAIFLNYRGQRYVNEWLVHNSLGIANANAAQGRNGDFLVLFNDKIVEILVSEGPQALGVTAVPGGGARDFVQEKFFMNMKEELPLAEKLGIIESGDTLKELAQKLGMESEILEEEVERYNGYCKNGKDEDFFKDAALLHSMEKGRYYMLRASSDGMGSVGGIRIDHDMRVLTPKRTPIPGLYGAGACAGGIWGNDSYGILEGATCSWAYTSGRMAGSSAAKYALDKM